MRVSQFEFDFWIVLQIYPIRVRLLVLDLGFDLLQKSVNLPHNLGCRADDEGPMKIFQAPGGHLYYKFNVCIHVVFSDNHSDLCTMKMKMSTRS